VNLELRYLGRSDVENSGNSSTVRFAPNLSRERTFFDGRLQHPLRFREAVSALHEIVMGDLRVVKKDRGAWQAWKQAQLAEQAQTYLRIQKSTHQAEMAADVGRAPAALKEEFHKMHGLYWKARRQWEAEIRKQDPVLFRALVPCDPIVTVAPDSVFFECFSKDESSYGCLLVERSAFLGDSGAGMGTTNVDYSLALYDHFQTLRTYRDTRLLVDPSGFEVKVEDRADYREEKIDLPPSWLRGFGQLQAAMGLPTTGVQVSVEAAYSLLAHLKRHREKTGPRSILFRLKPGAPAVMVLQPWGVEIPCGGAPYDGPAPTDIKVWGRRRLMTLARVLPLAERVDVHLMGSGLPSVWVVRMGEMRLVLALSGWTANDWTRTASLELLGSAYREDPGVTARIAQHLGVVRQASLSSLMNELGVPRDVVLGALHGLARRGQLMFDFAAQVYRWRSVLPVALSENMLGAEHPELAAARMLHLQKLTVVTRAEVADGGRRLLVGTAEGRPCEALINADGRFVNGRCDCSFFFKNKLRAGPCRHLLSLRMRDESAPAAAVYAH